MLRQLASLRRKAEREDVLCVHFMNRNEDLVVPVQISKYPLKKKGGKCWRKRGLRCHAALGGVGCKKRSWLSVGEVWIRALKLRDVSCACNRDWRGR